MSDEVTITVQGLPATVSRGAARIALQAIDIARESPDADWSDEDLEGLHDITVLLDSAV